MTAVIHCLGETVFNTSIAVIQAAKTLDSVAGGKSSVPALKEAIKIIQCEIDYFEKHGETK